MNESKYNPRINEIYQKTKEAFKSGIDEERRARIQAKINELAGREIGATATPEAQAQQVADAVSEVMASEEMTEMMADVPAEELAEKKLAAADYVDALVRAVLEKKGLKPRAETTDPGLRQSTIDALNNPDLTGLREATQKANALAAGRKNSQEKPQN